MSYRQIMVGQFMTGMVGLDELFARCYQEGHAPDEDGLGQLLVQQARKDNYIPAAGEAEYATALLREYRKHCDQQDSGCTCQTDYGTWHGHPREMIPWYPTLMAEWCDGCEACLHFCAFGVYTPAEDGKVMVTEPFKCQVGCDACARLCRPGAISFPPRDILKTFGG